MLVVVCCPARWVAVGCVDWRGGWSPVVLVLREESARFFLSFLYNGELGGNPAKAPLDGQRTLRSLYCMSR